MVSRTGLHALRALAVLASLPPGTFRGTAALAAEVGAPGNYLGKLLQGLARNGMILSRKGAGGGFALGKPAREVSLFEALDPLEGFERWAGCFLGHAECSERVACPLHASWGPVRDRYLDFLRRTTLADIVAATAPDPARPAARGTAARGPRRGARPR
jgi:Rrf2 family protein